MVVRREIMFPVFLECCEISEDPYWKSIYEDLAYGRTVEGTYISKGFLRCNHKGKSFSYKLDKTDPEEVCKDIYRIFSTKLGIQSMSEKHRQAMTFYDKETCLKNTVTSWADIRKKSVKELLIELFVFAECRKYSLPIKTARYILSLIYLGTAFKVLPANCIEFEDGHIVSIDGLHVYKDRVEFHYPLYGEGQEKHVKCF